MQIRPGTCFVSKAAATRPASRTRNPAVERGEVAAARMRWDRISRYGLLIVFAGLLFLYVNPARSYLHTMSEASHRKAGLHSLQRQHDRLLAREHALADPHVVEVQARSLGMILPGERPYIVRGLPGGK